MTEETIRILLVQNSEFYAAQLRSALESGPQQVKLTVVQSLAQARKCLSEALCDLALIDQDLPDGKGQELLPGDPAAAVYPALILSSREDLRAAVAALKAGAWDYLVKSEGLLSELPEIIARTLAGWQRILEHRRTEAALQESEEQFRSFFESAASGMAIISPEGRPLRVNPTFCRLSGYTEAEAMQKNVLEVTHPDDREDTRRLYGEIATGRRRVIDQEKRYLRKDGVVVWGHATVAGVFGPDGALKCFSANVQDITERKAAEEALIQANRELDAFVYTVSHDLRSPLTPIIGYAEVLQLTCRQQLDEQSLNFLAEIENQGRRMQALLEDLLVLAMVGEVERPALPVDLNAELGEVLLGLGSQMAEAGVTAKQNPLPTAVRLPRSFLTQIFINLIGNAIRYAGAAGSPIEIGGERVGDLVQLYVRDHGPGIPPAERSRIFEVFYRGSSGHHLPGSGVGLATVLKIARLYGGRAWVEETPGGGCTFRVEVQDDAQP